MVIPIYGKMDLRKAISMLLSQAHIGLLLIIHQIALPQTQ